MMAYEAPMDAMADEARSGDFRRGERLIVLTGAASFGLIAGLIAALALGRVGLWPFALVGAPLFAFAIYLSCATMHDALARRAWGCATAAMLVVGSLFAWPLSALIAAQAPVWAAPLAVMSSMVLLASCWSGAANAVYRMCGQAAIVGAGAAYLGVVTLLS
jgi:hypothetical protein